MANLQSTSPAIKAVSITPDDSNDLTKITRGLYVGTSGDIAVILSGDTSSVTLKNLAAGVEHAISVKRVLATGTTATDIIGLS